MCKTWPAIEEIIERGIVGSGRSLPKPLRAELVARYAAHGTEYALPEQRDGVPLNACTKNDSLRECEEEIVDAVFNALVYGWKGGVAIELLRWLLFAWDAIQRERAPAKPAP